MEKQRLKKLLDVAAGRTAADLVIKNGKVINVFSGDILERDVAVCDGLVAGVGDYNGKTELDAEGKYVLPGLIESHMHIEAMEQMIHDERILGLGEFMDFAGVINAEDPVLDKLLVAARAGKLIDGHCPGVAENDLNAYAAAGVHTDHECSTVEEMQERINNGMYVQLRQGSCNRDPAGKHSDKKGNSSSRAG